MKLYTVSRRNWVPAAVALASAMRWMIISVLIALFIHSVAIPY